jgi:hypothetical protein
MELIKISPQIISKEEVITTVSKGSFIGANTEQVTLEHLKSDCIIPVFSKDNESTISHYQFIKKASEAVQELFPNTEVYLPNIRVSHIVKGRIPSAVGKPAKELLEHEKTLYYERCAFTIEVPSLKQNINGHELSLSIGGVRAYNQENLYGKKSMEKFKAFIGFTNKVCTNLCVSTDGFSNEIRIASINELEGQMKSLFSNYNSANHLNKMRKMSNYKLSQRQFAHLLGKLRMYQHLDKQEKEMVFPVAINDSQINNVARDYYQCPHFSKSSDGSIDLWKLYNLFTEANKSSYIDSNLERSVNAYELINNLGNSIQFNVPNWLLTN